MTKRNKKVPQTWRIVDDAGTDYMGIQNTLASRQLVELWALTLCARFVPHMLITERYVDYETGIENERLRLFVPALWESVARYELFSLAKENQKQVRDPLVAHETAKYTLLILLPLILFHGIYSGWFSLPFEHIPDSEFWLLHGKSDAFRMRAYNEWWRSITALSLHADSLHLFGNILFSGIFFTVLSRRIGLGYALFFSVLSAFAANISSVYLRPIYYSSIGFSTALFACIGMICGDMFIHGMENTRHRLLALLPLCAGAGLLALLGTQGERTDYLAHILGLVWGMLIGGILALINRKFSFGVPHINTALIILTYALFLWAWILAFQPV